MASTLPFQDQCCTPCDDVPVVNIPGATGNDGSDGTDGAAGENAYTYTLADFTVPDPAVNPQVQVNVNSNRWCAVGQVLFIVGAGYYRVVSKSTNMIFILENLNYTGNAVPGTVIVTGSAVTAGGLQGSSGTTSGAAGGDLKGTFPNPKIGLANLLGSIIVGDGVNCQTLVKGSDFYVLTVDPAAAYDLAWKQVNLANAGSTVTGLLDIMNGGTGAATKNAAFTALSPMTTTGDLITRNGAVPDRIASGTTGYVLTGTGAGSIPVWALITTANLNAQMGRSPVDCYVVRYSAASGTAANTVAADMAWHPVPIDAAFPTGGNSGGGHIVLNVGNTMTLAAGTYRVSGWCDFWGGFEEHSTRLQNTDDGVTLVQGGPVAIWAGLPVGELTFKSTIQGRFTLAASKTVEFQYVSKTGAGTDKLGYPATIAGTDEVYASLMFHVEAL